MEIIAIDKNTYNEVTRQFQKFVNEIKEICYSSKVSYTWLDNQEVCQVLKISKRTLQYYRDSGKLRFSQIGNKCYYRNVDIQELIYHSTIKNS